MKSIKADNLPKFDCFQSFCDWYCHTGPYVLYPPEGFKSIVIAPSSTQTILFRHDFYQVELYLINFWIPSHCHPYCETCEYIAGSDLDKLKINPNAYPHGGADNVLNDKTGYLLLVLQNWNRGKPPTDHISLCNYMGAPLSNEHKALMKERYPHWINPQATWIDTRS